MTVGCVAQAIVMKFGTISGKCTATELEKPGQSPAINAR